MPAAITLYTTAGCHLCEQASDLLLTVNPALEIHAVDIATDDGLIAEYGERIPVVRHGERELAWPFGLLEAREFLLLPPGPPG